jgi:hypothetical protein
MKEPKYKRVWVRIKHSHPKRWRRGWKKLPTWRVRIVEAMDWGLANEPQIHYLQERPFNPNAIRDRKLPLSADCSATTTQLYRAAGRPDPNGRDYDGSGYTGTLRLATPSTRLEDVKPGDFIIYGRGSGVHVVVVYKAGKDPLVWSHGQERGPFLIRHSEEIAAHGPIFTCHDGDKL